MVSCPMMEKTPPANYLEVLADHVPLAVAVFDKEMRYIRVSQEWLEMFDLPKNIIGCSHYDAIPNIPDEWKEYHRQGLQGQTIKKEKDFFILYNGHSFWLNWEVHPWRDEQGQVAGIIIMAKDITDKVLLDRARLEGEQKFEVIFDQAAIGIVQVSLTGQFLLVNEQFCRMIGYSKEELMSKTFMEITYPDDIGNSTAQVDIIKNSPSGFYQHEKRYVKKDGTVIWAYLTVSLLRDEHGNPQYFVTTALDISARKKMEQAVLESEQKFKAMFDQTAMGLAQVALDGRIINANEKCCDVFGYPPEEIQGMTFQQITHPDDLETDLAKLEQLLEGKIQTYSIEKRYIKKNHSITWAFLTVSLVKDANGKPLYFISAVHDINKRKLDETELNQSRADLKRRVDERTAFLSLLQRISSEANKSDNAYQAIKVSLHEICKFTKWQIGHFYMVDDSHRDKVPHSDLWCLEDEKFYHPFVERTSQLLAHDMSIIKRVITSGKPFWSNDIFHDRTLVRSDIGLQVGIKSGMAFPVLVGEEVAGVLEFFCNINIHPSPALMELMGQIGVQLGRTLERKKAKDALEISQNRLQSVIDNLPARIYLKDRNKKYLLVNKVFKDFFKFGDREMRGFSACDFFSPEVVEPWAKDDDKVINEGKVISYEVTYGKNQKGQDRIFSLTKFPVKDADDNIYAFGGISFEITELKETEVRMRALLESEHLARTEAEKAIAARDEFISIASHELKSPITALKMKIQIFLRQLMKEPSLSQNPALKDALCKLDHDADRLVTLINRLLDITRIQTGHFELNREEVVVNELIDNLLESISPQLELAKSKLEVEIKDEIKAFWDKSRIEQVFVNLLSNAMKFGEGNPIKLSVKCDHNWARIIVQDYGRGIPKEFQDKIFDRYERANVKEGIQGLGLGLYIVRQILETHGGHIRVESTPGKGSTFIVDLPLRAGSSIPTLKNIQLEPPTQHH